MIILLILIILSLDDVWILSGEDWCWSLLGVKGLMTARLCLASQRIPAFREDLFHRSMLIRSNKLQNLVVKKDCGVRSPEETNPHAYIFFSLYIFKITPIKGNWPLQKYHNIQYCSLFVTLKFWISIVFSFSWELAMKMTTAQVVETSVAVNNNRFYSGLRSRGWSNSTHFWNRSWVQTFHTSSFVRLKDQGFSYNKYFCEDGKVSGLGNLPSETNLTVNKDQENHYGLSISSRRGLEKY